MQVGCRHAVRRIRCVGGCSHKLYYNIDLTKAKPAAPAGGRGARQGCAEASAGPGGMFGAAVPATSPSADARGLALDQAAAGAAGALASICRVMSRRIRSFFSRIIPGIRKPSMIHQIRPISRR